MGGRSWFEMKYHWFSKKVTIRRSTGNEGQLKDRQIRRIFDRYQEGSIYERHMTSFYTDPTWVNTPDRVLAPYVAAVIREWAEEVL